MDCLSYREQFALREIATKLRDASERKNALAAQLTRFRSGSRVRRGTKRDPVRLEIVRAVQEEEALILKLKSERHAIQPYDPAIEGKIRISELASERDKLADANEKLAGLAKRGLDADRLTVENNRLSARCISLETMIDKLQHQLSELRERKVTHA